MQNTSAVWIWIVVAVVFAAAIVLLASAAVVARGRARARRAELRQRFGPEYDRVAEELGGPARAERELIGRQRRVAKLHFRELSADEHARFTSEWGRIQAQFVDDPTAAVLAADSLVEQVMRARGYPTDTFDREVEDLSVDHGAVVQHYRAARALCTPARSGQSQTEDLRQALVHYRALIADLLAEMAAPSPRMRPQHA